MGWEGWIGVKHRHSSGCWAQVIKEDGWEQIFVRLKNAHIGLHAHVGGRSIQRSRRLNFITLSLSHLCKPREVPLAPQCTCLFLDTHAPWFIWSVTYCTEMPLLLCTLFSRHSHNQCRNSVFALIPKWICIPEKLIFHECNFGNTLYLRTMSVWGVNFLYTARIQLDMSIS